jgi:hypothetical protein
MNANDKFLKFLNGLATPQTLGLVNVITEGFNIYANNGYTGNANNITDSSDGVGTVGKEKKQKKILKVVDINE